MSVTKLAVEPMLSFITKVLFLTKPTIDKSLLLVDLKAENRDSGVLSLLFLKSNLCTWNQVTALKASMTASARIRATDSEEPKALKEQAFATPEKVAEMISKVRPDFTIVVPSSLPFSKN